MDLAGLLIDRAPDNRACMHIQTNTQTISHHWGVPHMWLYGQGPHCPQSTSHASEAPSLNTHTV